MEDIEILIIQTIQKIGCEFFDFFFGFFSILGEVAIYVALVPVFYWCVDKSLGENMTLSLYSSSYYGGLLKGWFSRIRPVASRPSELRKGTIDFFYDSQIHDGQYLPESLPSGHTQAATSFVLPFVYKKGVKKYWYVLLIPIFIALSRMYFGLHWPTDILCGFALGIVMSTILNISMNKKRNITLLILPIISVLAFIPCFFIEVPHKQFLRCLMMLALILGSCMGMYIEGRFINFSTDDIKLSKKLLRIPVGLLVALAVVIVPFIIMCLCGLTFDEMLVPISLLASFTMSVFAPMVFKKYNI